MGIVSGIAVLLLSAACSWTGVGSGLDLPYLFGLLLTGRNGAAAYLTGYAGSLVLLGCLAFIYDTIFELTGSSGAPTGTLVGLGQWVIVGVLLGVFSRGFAGHQPPGFFALGYGGWGAVVLILLHAFYGGAVGGLHGQAIRRRSIDQPRIETISAGSPLADSVGQGTRELEDYKRRPA